MAATTSAIAPPETVEAGDFRPTTAGITARVIASILIAAAILLLPLTMDNSRDDWIALAAIYSIIGLSINVITGHAGQISLGHQAFVGIGAFMSAFVALKVSGFNVFLPPPVISAATFWLGVLIAGATGAVMALALGAVALRIRGLYLALITLAFGLMAESTVFGIREFTGGGAGAPAPRPTTFASNQAFAYLSLLMLGLFLLVDWRLTKTKAGRAIIALRNDERVASTLGARVTAYKLLAFAVAGVMAGVAGALFAHRNTFVQAEDFSFLRSGSPIIWVLMAVVGGLGSRAGVVIGSSFFALFDLIIGAILGGASPSITVPGIGEVLIQSLTPLVGAILLLVTITLYPGGIGQQLLPIRRWLAGGPFLEHRHRRRRRGRGRIASGPGGTAAADADAGEDAPGTASGRGTER